VNPSAHVYGTQLSDIQLAPRIQQGKQCDYFSLPPTSAKPPLDNHLKAPRHSENPAHDPCPLLGSNEVDFVMGEVLDAYIPILGGCILTESNPKKGSKSRKRLVV
jgi:hypothetical protein